MVLHFTLTRLLQEPLRINTQSVKVNQISRCEYLGIFYYFYTGEVLLFPGLGLDRDRDRLVSFDFVHD
jgi:hypothetical protein